MAFGDMDRIQHHLGHELDSGLKVLPTLALATSFQVGLFEQQCAMANAVVGPVQRFDHNLRGWLYRLCRI